MVFDETADLAGALRRIAAFFRDESCGQCVPCRVGHGPPGGAARAARRRAAAGLVGHGARAVRRPRPGDARRVDLRPRPDGVVGDRERDQGRAGPLRRHRGRGMTDIDLSRIYTELPARPSRVPEAPPAPEVADRRAQHRRRAGRRPGRVDDPRGRPIGRHRHPDAVLSREPDAGQRVPGVRGRGHRVARARPGLLAARRGRDGGPDRQRARSALPAPGAGAARVLGRPVAGGSGRARRRPRPIRDAVRRRRDALRATCRSRRPPASAMPASRAITTCRRSTPPTRQRPRPSPSRSRSTTTSTCATTRAASSATSASRRAARTPRTRSRSRSPDADSTPGSRPSSTCRSRSRPASTAATASASAPPAR